MSDMDDDLLALAGADEETEEEEVPVKRTKSTSSRSRKRTKHESSDEEEEEEEEDQGDDDDDDDDGGDDDEETEDEVFHKNPYPLEGKYIDEEDKLKLERMPEIEREQVLYDRGQEMEEYRQQELLEQRMKERKRQEQRQKRSSKKPEPKNKLKELKKRREAKAGGDKKRAAGIDEDEEYEDEEGPDMEGDDYYEEDEEDVQWAEPEKKEALTYHHLNAVLWTRQSLAKFCHYPVFEEMISGSTVRINTGTSYNVGIVKELVSCKPYNFEDARIDQQLRVAMGPNIKTTPMGAVSNGEITHAEFENWKMEMENANLSLPSVKKFDRKKKELREFHSRPLTNEDIDEIIRRKKQLSGAVGVDIVVQKAQLNEERAIALENGDHEKVNEITAKLKQMERPTSAPSPAQKKSASERLANLSRRNRKSNFEDVRRAEVLANEQRRKAEAQGKAADPFSRLKTRANYFVNVSKGLKSDTGGNTPQKEKADEKPAKKHPVHLDDVIAKVDIVWELDF